MSEELKRVAIITRDLNDEKKSLIEKFFRAKNLEISFFDAGSARKELWDAMKKILQSEEVDIEKIQQGKYNEQDLVIKIGNEPPCLNDSLILGLEYAEIYFLEKEIEQLEDGDLQTALDDFYERQRNFGS